MRRKARPTTAPNMIVTRDSGSQWMRRKWETRYMTTIIAITVRQKSVRMIGRTPLIVVGFNYAEYVVFFQKEPVL